MKILNKIAAHERKLSVVGTAFACAMSCLTCSFWQFEGYLSHHVIEFLMSFAAVVMMLIWAYSSFANGLIKRTGFAVFTALYWVIPFIVADIADGMTDPRKFNIHVYVAGEYCKLMGIDALCLTPLKSLPGGVGCVVFSSVCLVIFLAAMFIGKGLGQEQETDPAEEKRPKHAPAPATEE
ncbi:MAG: hypothetical protein IJ080_03595 [Oscillospiraceae bacterium]|nr:hypothetical protein [Oscillospiraceae bacterium]